MEVTAALEHTAHIAMHGGTDIGKVRRINEDAFQLFPRWDTLVVCDGMGGHAAGEVASKSAVDTVAAFLGCDRAAFAQKLPPLDEADLSAEAADMVHAIRLANRSVFVTAQSQKSMYGMGTTLVAVRFAAGGAIVGHVGDSRAYLLSDGNLTRLTTDHSLVEELKAHGELTAEQEKNFPEKNVITRALGTRPSVAVDVCSFPTKQGDWFMLCSDGLCGYVDDPDIARIMNESYPNVEQAVSRLIEAANAAGGHDNVTIGIAAVESSDSSGGESGPCKTIAEPGPDESQQELAFLEELRQSIPDEPESNLEQTDRIRIGTPASQPQGAASKPDGGPAPEATEKKSKRGFWPWS